ncbi:VPLPA-CTERM sorting domain-containing protein [Halioglobus sp. Uisw_031]|uniref:VPLPA-CTERM sorting domain-containing protein n=1 Tax=Halioglobus sp. Uisw_031 TaxID=3230977 RepID=UPI0039ED7DDA
MKNVICAVFFLVAPLSAHAAFILDLGYVPGSVADTRSTLSLRAYDDFYTFSVVSDVDDAKIKFALEPSSAGFFQAGGFRIELFEGVSNPVGVSIASAESRGDQPSLFLLADLSGDTNYALRTAFNYNGANEVTAAATTSVTVVPVPAAAWLFGSGLIGLISLARRKKHRIVS